MQHDLREQLLKQRLAKDVDPALVPATEARLRPSCQDVQSGSAREPPQQVPDDVPDLSRLE